MPSPRGAFLWRGELSYGWGGLSYGGGLSEMECNWLVSRRRWSLVLFGIFKNPGKWKMLCISPIRNVRKHCDFERRRQRSLVLGLIGKTHRTDFRFDGIVPTRRCRVSDGVIIMVMNHCVRFHERCTSIFQKNDTISVRRDFGTSQNGKIPKQWWFSHERMKNAPKTALSNSSLFLFYFSPKVSDGFSDVQKPQECAAKLTKLDQKPVNQESRNESVTTRKTRHTSVLDGIGTASLRFWSSSEFCGQRFEEVFRSCQFWQVSCHFFQNLSIEKVTKNRRCPVKPGILAFLDGIGTVSPRFWSSSEFCAQRFGRIF